MSFEIFLKYFVDYLFFPFNTWFQYLIVWYFVYSILCKLYILWIGVLDWHIHCARVWYEIIKIVEHSLDFQLGSWKSLHNVENVSGKRIFFYQYRILFWNFEICTISIFWKDVFIIYLLFIFKLFRLLSCLHIFADFVLLLDLVDDTPWWKRSIE